MKLIGFIKEHDNIAEAIGLDSTKHTASKIETEKVIQYLDQGKIIFGWMGYAYDLETKKPIAPHSYHSDGVWVWPSYFSYYLKKHPTMNVAQEFIEYLETKNYRFEITENFDSAKIGMEKDLLAKQ